MAEEKGGLSAELGRELGLTPAMGSAHLAGFYSPVSVSLTDPPPPVGIAHLEDFSAMRPWTLSELLPTQLDSHPVFGFSTLRRLRR